MGNSGVKEEFETLVDNLKYPSKVDAVCILRSHKRSKNLERLACGEAEAAWFRCLLIQPYELNTLEEIKYIAENGDNVLLVTHKSHSFRTMLTVSKVADFDRLLWLAVVDDEADPLEEDKIVRYQKKGDIASYEEGIAYLKWLKAQ